MKIGILTFQNTLNYGAILQEYALNKVLNEQCECEVIDYKCNCVEERERVKSFSEIKSLKGKIKYIFLNKKIRIKRDKVKKFVLENVKVSENIYHREDISESQKYYDAYIVGSDQVWNYNLTGSDMTYLLDFASEEKGKYSYAASFGLSELQKHKEVYKNNLNKFDAISVREEAGKKIVDEISNKKAIITLDPTFLLTKQEWQKLIRSNKKRNKKYVVLYQMQESDILLKYAINFAKQRDCELINLNPFFKDIFKTKTYIQGGPDEWLEFIQNSEAVITNSFHGLSFCIIFQKDFIVEVPDNKNKTSSRLKNLLDMFQLNNRDLTSNNFNIEEAIDWQEINKKLVLEREKSINYLEDIVKEVKSKGKY